MTMKKLTIEERFKQLPFNPDETVYRLCYADAMCIVADDLTQEQLDILTDKQLEHLVQATADNFENIDWYEWGKVGYEFACYDVFPDDEEVM